MAARKPVRSSTSAQVRAGMEARPALTSAMATATARRRASRSRNASVSARLSTSMDVEV